MFRTFAWLLLFGVLWQGSDSALAQLFRRHVRTARTTYCVPEPWVCVDGSPWRICPGPAPIAVYSCDGCVIWVWPAEDACCQPCQPSGEQKTIAPAEMPPTPEQPTRVRKPTTTDSVPEPVEQPTTPPPTPVSPPQPAEPAEPAEPAASTSQPELKDIEATLEARGGFDTLLASAKDVHALEGLTAGGPFTVFAPTDDAFAKLDPGVMERLRANPGKLYDLMLYHAIPGQLTAEQALKQGNLKTVQGSTVRFRRDAAKLMVNDAEVTEADITCTNGVLHVIDRVLLPQGFQIPVAATKPAEEEQPSTPATP